VSFGPYAALMIMLLAGGIVASAALARWWAELRREYARYLAGYARQVERAGRMLDTPAGPVVLRTASWAERGWPPLAFRAWVTVEWYGRTTHDKNPDRHDRYVRYVGGKLSDGTTVKASKRWRAVKWICFNVLGLLYANCVVCKAKAVSLHHTWYGTLYHERLLWDFMGMCWHHHELLHDWHRASGMPLPVASYAYVELARKVVAEVDGTVRPEQVQPSRLP
jgi:hypothetical protein